MIKEAGMAKIMAAGRVLGIGKTLKGLEESRGSLQSGNITGK